MISKANPADMIECLHPPKLEDWDFLYKKTIANTKHYKVEEYFFKCPMCGQRTSAVLTTTKEDKEVKETQVKFNKNIKYNEEDQIINRGANIEVKDNDVRKVAVEEKSSAKEAIGSMTVAEYAQNAKALEALSLEIVGYAKANEKIGEMGFTEAQQELIDARIEKIQAEAIDNDIRNPNINEMEIPASNLVEQPNVAEMKANEAAMQIEENDISNQIPNEDLQPIMAKMTEEEPILEQNESYKESLNKPEEISTQEKELAKPVEILEPTMKKNSNEKEVIAEAEEVSSETLNKPKEVAETEFDKPAEVLEPTMEEISAQEKEVIAEAEEVSSETLNNPEEDYGKEEPAEVLEPNMEEKSLEYNDNRPSLGHKEDLENNEVSAEELSEADKVLQDITDNYDKILNHDTNLEDNEVSAKELSEADKVLQDITDNADNILSPEIPGSSHGNASLEGIKDGISTNIPGELGDMVHVDTSGLQEDINSETMETTLGDVIANSPELFERMNSVEDATNNINSNFPSLNVSPHDVANAASGAENSSVSSFANSDSSSSGLMNLTPSFSTSGDTGGSGEGGESSSSYSEGSSSSGGSGGGSSSSGGGGASA